MAVKNSIKTMISQFLTIIAFVWASSLLLVNEVIKDINAVFNTNPTVNILAVAVLFFIGFKLSSNLGGNNNYNGQ